MLATQNKIRLFLAAWAEEMMDDVLEGMRAVAGPVEAGDAPDLPTCGLEWGTVVPMTTVPQVTAGDDAELWRIQDEEVSCAFVWRAATLEQADQIAHEFVGRAALAAVASNASGTRVLHMRVNLGGSERTAKLYLEGVVEPAQPADTATRSLFVQRVPAVVTYPSFYTRDGLSRMNVSIAVNGESFPIPEETDA